LDHPFATAALRALRPGQCPLGPSSPRCAGRHSGGNMPASGLSRMR